MIGVLNNFEADDALVICWCSAFGRSGLGRVGSYHGSVCRLMHIMWVRLL